MIGIYKITNPIGHIYIGASANVKRRISHYYTKSVKSQRKIYESLNEYGVENHSFDVIEECAFEDLNERERYWQEYYNVLENGLNCQLTRTKDKAGRVSEETKKLNSEAKKGDKHPLFGKKCPEHAEKLRGRKHPERGLLIAGEKNCMFGKTHTEEARIKISIALKGKMAGDKNPMHGKIRPEVGNKNVETKGKKVIHTETGEIYPSTADAARKNNICISVLKSALSGKTKNKYPLKRL